MTLRLMTASLPAEEAKHFLAAEHLETFLEEGSFDGDLVAGPDDEEEGYDGDFEDEAWEETDITDDDLEDDDDFDEVLDDDFDSDDLDEEEFDDDDEEDEADD